MKKSSLFCLLWICAGVICTLYGLFVGAVNSGTHFYLIWFIIAALFFVLSLFSAFHIWAKIPRVWQTIVNSLICVSIVLFIIVEGLILGTSYGSPDENLDYIIVLGAQIYDSGPSTVLKYRLDTAYDYLVDNGNTYCIVTGGQGNNEPFPEAEGMKKYLVKKGIDSQRIICEEEAENTSENISNSLKLVDLSGCRVGLITNDFHMFRALHIAKKQGLTNVCGIKAESTKSFLPENLLREFFAVIKDFIVGNI